MEQGLPEDKLTLHHIKPAALHLRIDIVVLRVSNEIHIWESKLKETEIYLWSNIASPPADPC